MQRCQDGLIVACDHNQEWLLSWWWLNYTCENKYPVTFIDLGMSLEARQWCQKRGDLVTLSISDDLVASKSQIDPEIAVKWEAIYGESVWKARTSWFKKPFAMVSSPYKRTIWLDLDCEVLGNLNPLFDLCDSTGFSLAKETENSRAQELEHRLIFDKEDTYNSGVIVFDKKTDLIEKWANQSISHNDRFWSDQSLLSRLIFNDQLEVKELPEIYNWRMSRGLNIHAVIIHWVGKWGKEYIQKYGGLRPELQKQGFLYSGNDSNT